MVLSGCAFGTACKTRGPADYWVLVPLERLSKPKPCAGFRSYLQGKTAKIFKRLNWSTDSISTSIPLSTPSPWVLLITCETTETAIGTGQKVSSAGLWNRIDRAVDLGSHFASSVWGPGPSLIMEHIILFLLPKELSYAAYCMSTTSGNTGKYMYCCQGHHQSAKKYSIVSVSRL